MKLEKELRKKEKNVLFAFYNFLNNLPFPVQLTILWKPKAKKR